MNYNRNWLVFFDEAPGGVTYLQTLLEGLAWTIGTATLSWLLALSMGILVGVARTTRLPWARRQIGRAHVCTPVTKAQLVCSLLLENYKVQQYPASSSNRTKTNSE